MADVIGGLPARPNDGENDLAAARAELGSRTHVRRTLDRVARALQDSRARQLRGEWLQAEAEAIVAASRHVLGESQALRAELRASVTAYAQWLHAEHVPPQRMLVLVKDAVRDGTPAGTDVFERRDLMESVVRWSIEAYYAA